MNMQAVLRNYTNFLLSRTGAAAVGVVTGGIWALAGINGASTGTPTTI